MRMHFIICCILIGCLGVNANVNAQKITLQFQNKNLESVFQAIEKQSSYTVWYDNKILKDTKPVTVDVKNVTIEEAIGAVLKDQQLSYKIVSGSIIIRPKRMSGYGDENQQQIPIKGKVTDMKGKSLPGVTVRIKGTNTGTVTDANGAYIIMADPGGVITFSFLGYQTFEIKINKQTEINITMVEAEAQLSETVIKGYYTTTIELNTGNVATVKSDVLERQPVTNVLAALAGRVAGLQVTQSSGVAGAPVKVQLRGQNSLTASNAPLYIVDGVPFSSVPLEQLNGINVAPTGNNNTQEFGNPLNILNPNDIESISVLKDADATAIYGSRGSNGVILITTKKGKAGKTVLSANVRHGAGEVTRMPKMMSTAEFIQFRKDAFKNSNITPTAANAPELLVWDQNQDFDWQNWYLGNTSRQTDASVNLSGGNAQTTFLLSGNFHDESAIVAGKSSYIRGGFHSAVGHTSLNGDLKIEANLFYNSDHNYLSGAQNSGPFYYDVIRTAPNFAIYDAAGKYNFPNGNANWLAKSEAFAVKNTDNFNGNLNISYAITPDLELKTNVGYSKLEIKERNGNPSFTLTPSQINQGGANASFGNNELKTYLVEPQLTYRKTISNLQLNLLAGGTVQENNTTGQQQRIIGYPNDLLLGSTNYGTVSSKSSNTVVYRYLSLFGRVNFNWNDKYILNGTIRRDGSTRFGSDRQFGTFGSIGAAWIFGKEDWIKEKLKALSYGKLRASWGTTGNDGIGDYRFLTLYSSDVDYGTTGTITPSQISNSRFQWEVNKKLEAAIELGFWQDRILLNVAWYRNKSGNQLVNYPLSSITGFTSYTANLPATIQNTGLEFDFNGQLISSKQITWNASLNLSLPKNKLLSFPNIERTAYASTYVIGKPTSVIQRYHYLGVDPNTGSAIIQDVDNSGTFIGASSFNNQGGDYIIAGKIAPQWLAGFNNTLKYGNWSFDLFFQYTKQEGYNLKAFANFFGNNGNVWSELSNYWRAPGEENVIPKPLATSSSAQIRFRDSDAGFGDASFLRLKNLSVSYELGKKILQRLNLGALKIYAQGQNLATVTKFKGFDPETATFPYIMIPPLKQFCIGLLCTL